MFTVHDALALEVMRGARVVAGAAGLEREVRWAHVVDVPEMTRWVRGGELVLTTAISLRDDPDGWRHLVPDLREKGLAGLVLAVGPYLERIPDDMAAQADEAAFPLIELPWDVPFEDVLMAVSEQIVNAQNALLRRSAEIHDRLTARVLQGGGFAELADDLAALLCRPVVVLDASYTVLAIGGAAAGLVAPGVDERLPRGLVDHLHAAAPSADHGAPAHVWRVAACADLGLHAPALLTPVVAGRQTLGFVLAGGDESAGGELDAPAVERAATVAALLFYKERAVREAERRLEASLFDRLLAGEALDSATEAAARRMGLDDAAHYVVALLHPGENNAAALAASLRGALTHLRRPRLYAERDDCLAVVLSVRDDASALARRLLRELAAPCPVLLAVGHAASLAALPASHDEAREALAVARQLNFPGPIILFDDLGLLHWLHQLPPAVRVANAFVHKVQVLAEYDAARGAGLLSTLEAYLRHGGAISEAAAALGVHRHTLTYRLDKIEKLCELDLADQLARLNLQVALLDHRLHHGS